VAGITSEWWPASVRNGGRFQIGIPAGITSEYLAGMRRNLHPASPFVFVSERGAPFTTAGFARMLERTAVTADMEIKVHPHMLRHACGFKLANDGHDTRSLQAYLGHKNIQHTVRYTELAPTRFKNFWRD
jgi:site-specific recombinase XerD